MTCRIRMGSVAFRHIYIGTHKGPHQQHKNGICLGQEGPGRSGVGPTYAPCPQARQKPDPNKTKITLTSCQLHAKAKTKARKKPAHAHQSYPPHNAAPHDGMRATITPSGGRETERAEGSCRCLAPFPRCSAGVASLQKLQR